MNSMMIEDWDRMSIASKAINDWANNTFPGRNPKASLMKLAMEEIPELLIHLKEKGAEDIGGELADCFILLLDCARIWGVNLPMAIALKMSINNQRMWIKDDTGFYNHVRVNQVADQSEAEAARRPATSGAQEDSGSVAMLLEQRRQHGFQIIEEIADAIAALGHTYSGSHLLQAVEMIKGAQK